MGSEDVVCLKRDVLLGVLRDLSTVVVSVDRIGSCYADLGRERGDQLLLEFFDRWEVWEKLSRARAALSEPFSTELGDDDMDELERELQDVPYWSLTRRTPPRKKRRR